MTGIGAKRHVRSGQAAAAVRARPGAVGRTLLKQTPVLCILTVVPGLAAMIEEETALATALLVPSVALAALGVQSRGMDSVPDLRRIEALVVLALVFAVSALLASPAFMTLGLGPLDALFEATSGITTTGLSVARGAEEWPVSAHLLRAWMQWCGGVVVAVAGIALLMDSGRAARVLGRESLGDDDDYVSSTRARARVVLVGYAALTAVGVAGATLLVPGLWEGPVLALAAVSTGGFAPRDNSLADYSIAAQIFVVALSVAGAVSLVFHALALRHGVRAALAKGTVPVTLTVILGGATAYAVFHGLTEGWAFEPLVSGVLNQVSAHTTAGFSAAPVSGAGPLLLLLIVAMVTGGDVGSTTGGIKMARVVTLIAMIGLIFLRLRLPARGLAHLKIGGHRAGDERIVFAAALVGVYALACAIFWLALLLGGHPPFPALFDAVSALSSVGLSTGVIGPELQGSLKGLAILAMLLGRLEFFAFILLLLPSTWISRR